MRKGRRFRKATHKAKQFGRLTADQVVEFFEAGREVVIGKSHLALMIGCERQRYWNLFPGGPTWTRHYLVSFQALVAMTYEKLGALWTIHNMAGAADPQASALAFAKNFDPALLGRPEPTKEQVRELVPLLVALENCWRCISYYSVTMCDVFPRALQGNERALMVAASIDPSIFWAPQWAPLVAAMSLERERDFFRMLGRLALKIDAKREQSRLLRVAEFVLQDAGAFAVASAEEMLDLIAGRLGMRSELGENPTKALSELFRRCRRERQEILGVNHAKP